jgi:hypothetical protein
MSADQSVTRLDAIAEALLAALEESPANDTGEAEQGAA